MIKLAIVLLSILGWRALCHVTNIPLRGRGPNVCTGISHKEKSCCPGWKPSPSNGLCLSAVCSYGCGKGKCVAPNVCRCPNGILKISCQSNLGSRSIADKTRPLVQNDQPSHKDCKNLKCHQKCQMIHGYPQCTCFPGFILRKDGVTCKDINECQSFHHTCQHGCRNTVGSFMCTCRYGYSLLDNGRTCRPASDYSTSACGSGNEGRALCQTGYNTLEHPVKRPDTSAHLVNPQWAHSGVPPCPTNDCLNVDTQPSFDFTNLPDGFLEWMQTNKNVYDLNEEFPEDFNEWLKAGRTMEIPDFYGFSQEGNEPCTGSDCLPENTKSYFPCLSPSCLTPEFAQVNEPLDCNNNGCDTGVDELPSSLSTSCHHGDTNCGNGDMPVGCQGNGCHNYNSDCPGGGCEGGPDSSPNFPLNPPPPCSDHIESGCSFESSSILLRKLRNNQQNCGHKPCIVPEPSPNFDKSRSGYLSDERKMESHWAANSRNEYDKKFLKSKILFNQRSTTRYQQHHLTSAKLREKNLQENVKNSKNLEEEYTDTSNKDGMESKLTNQNKAILKERGFNQGISTQVVEKMQADTRACRDDLCIESLILENIIDNPDDGHEMDCPDGYRKTENDDVTFCQPTDNAVSGESGSLPCQEGQRLVVTPTGSACEDLHERRDCSAGYILKENNGAMECVIMETLVEGVTCPDGQIPFEAPGGIVCHFPEDIRKLISCQPNTKPVKTIVGIICVDLLLEIPNCLKDAVLIETSTGLECVPMTTRGPSCPPGLVVVETDSGVACGPLTTESPACPAGLLKVETTAGILCRYVDPPRVEELSCQNGERLVNTADGSRCVKSNLTTVPPIAPLNLESCPHGQVLIDTPQGTICGFTFDSLSKNLPCSEGQLQVEGPDGFHCEENIDDYPCPPGLVAIESQTGIKCQYRTVRPGEDKYRCSDNKVLTQTRTGFFCRTFRVQQVDHQACSEGWVLVQTDRNVECLHTQVSLLVCSHGTELVRETSGFSCRNDDNTEIEECATDEVLVVDESGSRCIKMEAGDNLCGDGYRLIKMQDGTSSACRPLTLKLKCPEEFNLIQTMGFPECVSKTDQLENVSPCQDGYNPGKNKDGYSCILGKTASAPCDDDTLECQSTAQKKNCSSLSDTSGMCGELSDLYPEGSCIPRCANKGVCLNETCICPPGLTGKACQDDVNECDRLPDSFCQYGCQNSFGSYQCFCPDGYTINADGRTCKGIQCIPECLNGGRCVHGECRCSPGYTGMLCQDDIDECSKSDYLCEHICRNTYGSYACICPPGSRLQMDRRTCRNTTCIPDCKNGGRCLDHRCLCPRGYGGVVCQLDINECKEQRPCSHYCRNVPGSYKCLCPPGFVMKADQHTCHNVTPVTHTDRFRERN